MPAVSSRDALLTAQKSKNSNKEDKPYAVIFGTVWGPDDRPIYGVTVHIRLSSDKPKKVRWEVFSDHHGEFAQRVPAGEADYILTADLKHAKFADGKTLRLAQGRYRPHLQRRARRHGLASNLLAGIRGLP